jgi:release factor glutamine methyltransferase
LEVIQRSAEYLSRKGVDSPRLQVELLLAHVLKVPRLRLYLDFARKLGEPELSLVRELVKRRGNHEPLQHLVGSTSFCGLDIKVNRAVLIPRPETEILAEEAWQFLNRLSDAGATAVSALDFGTGSGCMAIAVTRHAPTARIVALDISSAALEVARENATQHGLTDRIEFVQGNGFDALPVGASFDLIVSNPPYIPSAEIEHLAPEVRDHDPRMALDGGADGLDMLRYLAKRAAPFLSSHGRLMCEFGDSQAEAVEHIFTQARWVVDAIVPDLSRRARIVVAGRPGS